MKVSNLPSTGLKNLSRLNCRKLWESDFSPRAPSEEGARAHLSWHN